MPLIRSLLALLFLSTPFFAFAADPEKILSFESRIQVEQDGTLDVIERIHVEVKGDVVKRGIFRDINTRYIDGPDNNRPVNATLQVVSVNRDGAQEPYSLESNDQGLRIRIGRESVLLPHQPTLYEIHYRTKGQLRRLKDRDELTWAAVGAWTSSIDKARS